MEKKKIFSPIYLTLVLILMYLPIVIVVLYAFNANTSRFTFNFTGFSLQYFEGLLHDTKGLVDALWNSPEVALYSCLSALVLGVSGAIGMANAKFRGQGLIESISLLPVMIPEIILAIAYMAVFKVADLKGDMLKLVLTHTTFCVPYIYLVVKARLVGMDPSLTEAARDLGASPIRAFKDVTLPLIMPGVLSGLLLAFAMSMDDFVISFFVRDTLETLPTKIYSSVKMGVSLQVNALCTVMLAVVAIIVGISRLLGSKNEIKNYDYK
jgi:spermidine/putrescine transport system permease protein